jgi:hypothetical protein
MPGAGSQTMPADGSQLASSMFVVASSSWTMDEEHRSRDRHDLAILVVLRLDGDVLHSVGFAVGCHINLR